MIHNANDRTDKKDFENFSNIENNCICEYSSDSSSFDILSIDRL